MMRIKKNGSGFFQIIVGFLLLCNIASADPRRFEIYKAVEESDLNKVKALMEFWPRCINDLSWKNGPYEGMTPFQLAIMLEEKEIVKYILLEGNVNFLKKEPHRGDNALFIAIRLNAYVSILNAIIDYLTAMYDDPECERILNGVLNSFNRVGETIFGFIILSNVINKAQVLQRLLEIGLRPRMIPFETDRMDPSEINGIYVQRPSLRNPLYVLWWNKEWETFFTLLRFHPEWLFERIEVRIKGSCFGNQSLIMRITQNDAFLELKEVVREYKTDDPFLLQLCRDDSETVSEEDANSLAAYLNSLGKIKSSEGLTLRQILGNRIPKVKPLEEQKSRKENTPPQPPTYHGFGIIIELRANDESGNEFDDEFEDELEAF
ncbi:MAG: ankyrin repeat domain-containing protein [Puniceicoccales bacterium]|jgi:hypothetical protein|nr:ankyrin repeat domain-containing protein [Puniceicoccales bacterium]